MQTKVTLTTELLAINAREGEAGEERYCSTFEAVCLYEESGVMLRHAEPDNNGRTEIVASPELVELKRTGTVSSRMVFVPGQLVDAPYVTPHGTLPVAVYTHALSYEATPAGGSISVKYSLLVSGSHGSDNELHINWTLTP